MTIGEEFIKMTSFDDKQIETDQMKGKEMPPLEDPPIGDLFRLEDPDPEKVKSIDLSVAIEERESLRSYPDIPLKQSDLSYLLWCTAGVKWAFPEGAFRTVPSAGCRHAIDTYLFIRSVEGIEQGIYRYISMEHALELIQAEPVDVEKISDACFNQPCSKEAAVIFLWVADAYRMTWRYGERGYRNLFLDAGHIGQNLYLSSQAVDCGICAIGAFKDEVINSFLALDGMKRFILYAAAVGKRFPEEEIGEE